MHLSSSLVTNHKIFLNWWKGQVPPNIQQKQQQQKRQQQQLFVNKKNIHTRSEYACSRGHMSALVCCSGKKPKYDYGCWQFCMLSYFTK